MKETVERYSFSGYLQSGPYLFQTLGLNTFFDIAYKDGAIWYACDDTSNPVIAFNTSGTQVFTISTSIIPVAHGLCFESSNILWVSDMDADKIYMVDLDPTGIGESEGTEPGSVRMLTVNSNPFFHSVRIEGTGFADQAQLEIFDLSGRRILTTFFTGSFTWNGEDSSGLSVPVGSYCVMVTDDQADPELLMIVRL